MEIAYDQDFHKRIVAVPLQCKAMSLVVIGSVAYDAIETPHGKKDRVLGGSCTYIALSASYFTKTAIVGVVGDDFDQVDRDLLADKRVDLEGLEQVPGKTFFWSGVYSADMNDRTTLVTDLNVFADFQPKIPPAYLESPLSFPREHSAGVAESGAERDERPALRGWRHHELLDLVNAAMSCCQTIRNWDFLLINDGEARMLAGENNLRKAAAKILDMGPNTLVIKRGEYGAMLVRKDTFFMVPGYLLDDVFDPTGAGDCFAGGFVGYLAERGFDLRGGKIDVHELHRAVIYGSVMGSFCCESFGVDRFRTLTRQEIDERYQEFRRFTAF